MGKLCTPTQIGVTDTLVGDDIISFAVKCDIAAAQQHLKLYPVEPDSLIEKLGQRTLVRNLRVCAFSG